MTACATSHPQGIDAARLLLSRGADPNLASLDGETALVSAVSGSGYSRDKHVAVLKLLLDAGADPTIYQTQNTFELCHRDAAPHLGETAAKTARRCGHLGLAKLLDAAERNHPKAWVAPPVEQVDFSVDLVTENRARLRRIFAAHPPPVVA